MAYTTILTWTRRGSGYYESTSTGGTSLVIQQDARIPYRWHLYAGDTTAPRGTYRTLLDAKLAADRLFA